MFIQIQRRGLAVEATIIRKIDGELRPTLLSLTFEQIELSEVDELYCTADGVVLVSIFYRRIIALDVFPQGVHCREHAGLDAQKQSELADLVLRADHLAESAGQ